MVSAGDGKRFLDAGYKVNKMSLPVPTKNGVRTMAQAVLDNVFDLFKDLDNITELIVVKRDNQIFEYEHDNIKIENIVEKTEGTLCSALVARKHITSSEELLVLNCDQLVEVDKLNFHTIFNYCKKMARNMLFTFNCTDVEAKWSYVDVDKFGDVRRVAQKEAISDIANCGLYYFNEAWDFVNLAESMIRDDERTNGEFYLCSIYNRMNNATSCINVSEMYPLGVPLDYIKYLNNFQLDYDIETNSLIPMEINW